MTQLLTHDCDDEELPLPRCGVDLAHVGSRVLFGHVPQAQQP